MQKDNYTHINILSKHTWTLTHAYILKDTCIHAKTNIQIYIKNGPINAYINTATYTYTFTDKNVEVLKQELKDWNSRIEMALKLAAKIRSKLKGCTINV